ncbi:hypothetical protein [Paraburkholderia tuberum]|uniref:Uncharacterized protein n=1 Tax=Paraburkholderia tuberum TaxID=157910 RepID=A0A1H1KLR4_9BURK|nr:hypothetical protein [Paraburkholderia tuberum]SDR62982.1 hypothetical protein SAMN05445850_8549 [Paraburkholderia tuberum]
MCYGDPDRLLELVIGKRALPKNDLGHTPLDDFEHFCAYTGCREQDLGPRAFAFVRLAYVTAGLNRRRYRSAGLDAQLEKYCADISMLLRDRPPGTTADITGDAVLYWDGGRLNGATLSEDDVRDVALPLELEDILPGARDAVAEWLARPTFSFRPSLLEWLDPLPPGAL